MLCWKCYFSGGDGTVSSAFCTFRWAQTDRQTDRHSKMKEMECATQPLQQSSNRRQILQSAQLWNNCWVAENLHVLQSFLLDISKQCRLGPEYSYKRPLIWVFIVCKNKRSQWLTHLRQVWILPIPTLANSIDPDQRILIRAFWSGSALFAITRDSINDIHPMSEKWMRKTVWHFNMKKIVTSLLDYTGQQIAKFLLCQWKTLSCDPSK